MRILPGVLKELAKHVPTVLFQTVEWSNLAHELPKISRRIIQKEGYAELFEEQQKLVRPFNIRLTTTPLQDISLLGNKEFGQHILELYFAQLHSPQGLFLDLRSIHFAMTDGGIKWHPSPFWAQFEDAFRRGLLKVYEGFYLENEELYFEGLTLLGLIQSEWSESDKRYLGELFKAQFGKARDAEMEFNLDHLKQTIIKMSDFMLQKKVKIPKDFLYLGIYLIGMYSSLEETKEKFPVKEIYLKVGRTLE